MAPTQSLYLYTGESTVDTTVWPPSPFQTAAQTQGEETIEPKPLYYFAGDTAGAEPPTTNGANIPDWQLYTGPAEPVPSAEPAAAATPSAAQAAEPSTSPESAPEGNAASSEPSSDASAHTAASAPEAVSSESPDGTSHEGVSEAAGAGETPLPDAGEPQTEPVATEAPAIPAAVIDGIVYRGRTDDDVLTGNFCRVIAGDQQGRYGVFTKTATLYPDGWPATVTIHTRDDRDELIVVNYADIRPAQPGGR